MADLVYGLCPGEDNFAVLDAEWARAVDKELSGLRAADTWDEAIAVVRAMTALDGPFDPDDLENYGIDVDEPYNYGTLPGVEDGDFPPMPAAMTSNWLPEDLLVKAGIPFEAVSTRLNGDYLQITPDHEEALVRVLAEQGHSVVRDDDLVEGISSL